MNNKEELLQRITITPGVMSGKLEENDVKAALLYASLKMNNTVVIHAAWVANMVRRQYFSCHRQMD